MPHSLQPQDIQSNEVYFDNDILSVNIKVTRENRGKEEFGPEKGCEKDFEAALLHRHGPTFFSLNSNSNDVYAVLKEADEHFQLERPLINMYPDFEWRGQESDGMFWEGQKSILVGRCDGEVVSIACFDLRFVSDDISSTTKYLSVGVGPFFVPVHLRGRAHSLELSIAVSYFFSVAYRALFNLMPVNGCIGGSLYPEYPSDADMQEVHPFVEQILDKLQCVNEMLKNGFFSRVDRKHSTFKFLPVTLER
jgi:hypothetical protein